MYKFLTKNGQSLALLVGVAIVAIFLGSVIGGMGDWTPEGDGKYNTGIFDFGLQAARILVFAGIAAILAFGIYHVITNFKGSLKGIIGFGLLALILLITYNMSSATPEPWIQGAIDKFEGAQSTKITEGNYKFISGGILTTLALFALGAVAIVLLEIYNFFK